MQIPPKHHKIHQTHINPSKTPRFLDIFHDFPISFTPFSQGDHLWGQSCFNCATYPASVGLPIPDDSGMLPQYLVELLQEGAR
jgi:hypothetical protein